jgi:ribosomal protein S4
MARRYGAGIFGKPTTEADIVPQMIYPGYLLNPGDMFQVEPERVLFATGAPKDAKERRVGRHIRRKAKEEKDNAVESGEDVQEQASEVASAPAAASGAAQESASVEETGDAESKRKSSKVELKYILDKAKTILNEKDKNDGLSAKRKQELRAFTASVRKAIGQINKKAVGSLGSTVSNLDDELATLLSNLSISKPSQSTAKPAASPSPAEESESSETEIISKEDRQALYAALKEARENPIDPTKPYATPWRPRPYMSAFAFIPRYLEVNQNICSAVYLRHPVVRPKLAEVPTPFSYETSQLAFAWYLRRR